MGQVRVDIALIPDDPLYSAVITASQAITAACPDNANVIDDKRFPPHLSLHIATIPHQATGRLIERLAATARELPPIIPGQIRLFSRGYIMLTVQPTPELVTLYDTTRRSAAEVTDRAAEPAMQRFHPHFSLAKLPPADHAEALRIARAALTDPPLAESRSLDICDIGPHSERWLTLTSL